MDRLEFAKALAAYAHEGQKDRGGAPYILHPIAVAEKMDTEEEKIVALLHDVLEDSKIEFGTLYNLFGWNIADAVDTLTKRDYEPYDVYIRRISYEALPRKVKMADLEHNMDASRLHKFTDKDRDRMEKYKKAYEILKAVE